ncbi:MULTISPECIES: hypothetical protein [Paraburkholderia]|uniref:ArsR family transcriptional regulator n=1 Tax=Paraburkholderia podalyriae TaxID=1938811 RepID=A0ABR7PQP6_9BURK|nr:hypothetical protein [Paraburkholderia podalyriae]
MSKAVKARRPDAAPVPLGLRLRRMLSAHEIATLLLLLQAPAELMAATPDVIALREVGLVQVVESEQGGATTFALTADGSAVLRALGAG